MCFQSLASRLRVVCVNWCRVSICMPVYKSLYLYMSVYVGIPIYLYIYVYICVYIYMYIYMYLYICLYVYILSLAILEFLEIYSSVSR